MPSALPAEIGAGGGKQPTQKAKTGLGGKHPHQLVTRGASAHLAFPRLTPAATYDAVKTVCGCFENAL